MNIPIIIDSSAFISLGTITDSNYQKASQISKTIEETGRMVIMPGEVFTEITNVVGKKVGHKVAITQANEILSSKTLSITDTTPAVRSNALEKFQEQPESVSFTDCLVMAFADEYETKEIFGFDETFPKNGYTRFGVDESREK